MNDEDIFAIAVSLPVTQRAGYLQSACAGDPDMLERIEQLLVSHEDSAFMHSPADDLDRDRGPESVRATAEESGDQIGNYQLLRRIGEGGFGTVWMAQQLQPVRRHVALKIVKLGMDTKSVIARFQQERQALAIMEHSSIAKVLDAGATPQGRPFFVMELVEGIRITQFCDERGLSTVGRLQLFIAVCQAVQHAHQKGIIHRDIKPSNILVTLQDGQPTPKVIDFGIAKAIAGRSTEAMFYTQSLHFVGTPAYMSPEQLEMSGIDIDTRSDIYSLGVLLYELLSGQTPFDGQKLLALGVDAMRKTIRDEEPVRPSTRLNQALIAAEKSRRSPAAAESSHASYRRLKETVAELRGDLDWIVMKCLEKDRSRRYDTASGLAADLRRHLQNEPVIARSPTPLYRFQKMVRRNTLGFIAGSAVLLALTLGLVIATTQAIRATKAEYTLEMNSAFNNLAENNLSQARRLLEVQKPKTFRNDLRGFEWRYLSRLCQGDEIKTFSDLGAAAAAFSTNGEFLVYSGAKIIVRKATSLELIASLPKAADTLSFAPHTNLLASGNRSGVTLWNTDTWQEVRTLPEATLPSLFSPNGHWLLTGGTNGFRVWDTETWRALGDCSGAPGLIWNARNAVAFSPDGQFLVTVAGRNEIGSFLNIWQLPSLVKLPEFRFGLRDRPGSVAFSQDGKQLITGLWDGQLVIREFATGKTLTTLKAHDNWITSVLPLPPDGKIIATAASDRTIRLWDAVSFDPIVRLRGHVLGVIALASSPDGSTIVSGGGDRTTKLWRSATRHTRPVLDGAGLVAGFLNNGRQLVAISTNGWCIWTPETGKTSYLPIPPSRTIMDSGGPSGKPGDVKHDEPLGALGRADGNLELWDLRTGAMVSAWPAHSTGISAVAFSPHGNLLATGSIKGQIKIWDSAHRREVGRFGPIGGRVFCLAFSSDGETVAASGQSSSVWLWERNKPENPRQLFKNAVVVASVAFSPIGKLLATSSMIGNEVNLWQLPSCRNSATLVGHVGATTAVAFSPDGRTLATAGTDLKVKLWNMATLEELTTIPVVVEFPSLAFSPDGQMLAIGEMTGDQRRIQVLEAPGFAELEASAARQR